MPWRRGRIDPEVGGVLVCRHDLLLFFERATQDVRFDLICNLSINRTAVIEHRQLVNLTGSLLMQRTRQQFLVSSIVGFEEVSDDAISSLNSGKVTLERKMVATSLRGGKGRAGVRLKQKQYFGGLCMNRRLFAVLAATLALVFGMTMQTLAQESTPEMGHDAMMTDEGMPAHIHAGVCPDVGDVVVPLNNLTSGDHMMDAAATPAAEASPVTEGESTSTTVAELPLADIIAGGHAINIHESVENIDVYTACGDIVGEVVNSELTIVLNEQNDSGLSGTAVFTDNGDGTTTIDLSVSSGGTEATPEASPAS